MARYVVVTDANEIINAILLDDPARWSPGPGLRVVREDEVDPAWKARASEAPASRIISPLEFRRRFTAAERAAITTAAGQAAAGGNPQLQMWMDDLAAAGEVDLDNADVAAGIAALAGAGLLTTARGAEVLAGPA
jgi:hypothetical protein